MLKNRKDKILLGVLVILVIISILTFPRAKVYSSTEHHYQKRYEIVKKDLTSDKKIGYAITNGIINPFYKDEYYFNLNLNFKYKTKTTTINKLIKDNETFKIPMDNFESNSKFNVELYDYQNNKKLKTVNLFPILKEKIDGLYLTNGFSDAYLSKEGKDLIFNLPLINSSEELMDDSFKLKPSKKYKIDLLKINLATKDSNIEKKTYTSEINLEDNEFSFTNLSLHNNLNVLHNYGYVIPYNKIDKQNNIVLIPESLRFYETNKQSKLFTDKFKSLSTYLDKAKSDNCLVLYFKDKKIDLKKELKQLKINYKDLERMIYEI